MADSAKKPIPENPSKITERPYKRTRLLGSLNESVTLLVGEGEQQTSISVHKNVLCASSPFFEAACKPEWMKADKVIELPEDDPEAVQGMVYWMYENKICVSQETRQRTYDYMKDPDDTRALKTRSGFFVKLYVLGEKYQISRLRNHALDACAKRWITKKHNSMNFGVVSYAYRNTVSTDSPLRRLLVQATRFREMAVRVRLCKHTLLLCPEFLHDLAFSCLEDPLTAINTKTLMDSICKDYHVHSQEGEKEACTISEYILDEELEF